MARLNKKEIRLLLAFSGTIFFAANVVALKTYLTALKGARSRIAAYTSQRQTIDALLSDRAYWEERQRWLDDHQPELEDPGAAQGVLIETLQKVARDRGITILEQTILEPDIKPYYQEIAARLKLTAPMKEMVEWLAEIQAPERFYIVNQLSLSVDTKSKEEELPALCTLQVGRVYRSQAPKNPLQHTP